MSNNDLSPVDRIDPDRAMEASNHLALAYQIDGDVVIQIIPKMHSDRYRHKTKFSRVIGSHPDRVAVWFSMQLWFQWAVIRALSIAHEALENENQTSSKSILNCSRLGKEIRE